MASSADNMRFMQFLCQTTAITDQVGLDGHKSTRELANVRFVVIPKLHLL
jgi:hypothetical protein